MFMDAKEPKLALREYAASGDHEKALATYVHSQLFVDSHELCAQLDWYGSSDIRLLYVL